MLVQEQDYRQWNHYCYLALRQESMTYLGYIATVGRWYLPMMVVGVAKCQLCKVVFYCAGSNGTEISVHYTE